MASSKPVVGDRLPLAILPFAVSLSILAACAARPPRLVPPAGGVEAVEGFGSASVSGAEASIKGKFGFVFSAPGSGRIEAVDPLGRTAFIIIFRDGRAWFVLPGRKVYAEDEAGLMMERFLGVALRPDEAVRLLSGSWSSGREGAWSVEADGQGRAARGVSGGFTLTVRTFFPGAAVPREIRVEGPAASGRIKILKLGFNPPPRQASFDTSFLRSYAPKTWEEILDLIDR